MNRLRDWVGRRHREQVIRRIPLATTDELAALVAVEADTPTRKALHAALSERRSLALVIERQSCRHHDVQIVTTECETGPPTAPMA